MNILVVGGAGYVGSKLVPYLIENKHEVTVIDWTIYGNHLPDIPIFNLDIRNSKKVNEVIKENKPDVVVNLASISNDPMGDVVPHLTKEINYIATKRLIDLCKDNGVEKFIFASSASVYGINDKENISEEVELAPISIYSKTKADIERYLIELNSEKFCTVRIRPATVCGYSPRQRLDLIVNLLTYQGYFNKRIRIEGGERIRPFIHIDDMIEAYLTIINSQNEIISGEVYNCGSEFISLNNLGKKIQEKTNCEIYHTEGPDKRSHRLNSKKIINKLGFKFKKNIDDAISDLIYSFDKNLIDTNDMRCFNLKWYKRLIMENKIK